MEFKTYMDNLFNGGAPNNSKKDIPLKPDENRDPIQTKSHAHKWTKVNGWDEIKKRQDVLGK
jgi:hypothetical protein